MLMDAVASIKSSETVTYPARAAQDPAPAETGLTFREVLSGLNPLQYLPVVGTLYRAITGDVIPRPLREAGSLVASGLIGGPVGVVTNLAMLGFEKLTGIDLEQVEQDVIASLIPPQPAVSSSVLLQSGAVEGAGAPAPSTVISTQADAMPWTAAQLAAYGVANG